MLGFSFNHRIHVDAASQRWDVYGNKSDCTLTQPDNSGSFLAYGTKSGSVELWDIRTVPVALCSLPPLPFVTNDLQISSICFSNDCTHIAVFACRKKLLNMGKKQYFSDNHSRQVFICSLSSSKSPVIFANFTLPFTISHMSFLGTSNTALLVGASEGKRGRFVLTAIGTGTQSEQPASCSCRELMIDEKGGKLSLSSILNDTEILAKSSPPSSSSAQSSSFVVHGRSLFTISESHALIEHSLPDTFLVSPQPLVPAHLFPDVIKQEGASSVPAPVNLSLLHSPNQEAHLLVTFEDHYLQVISLQGLCIFAYMADHGASILTAALVSPPRVSVTAGRESSLPPPPSEHQLAVALKRIDGSCRVLLLNMRFNIVTESIEVGKRVVADKIVLCSASPNPIRTLVIFGTDHRDSCCSFSFKFKSDFPGPMYPVAFSLLKRGITYTELEEELDLMVNGQTTSEVLDKDPMLQMLPSDVHIDIGESVHELGTSRRAAQSLSKLYFDEDQLRFDQPSSFSALSTPRMQEDVLDVSGNSQMHLNAAWTNASGTGNSKKAILPELGVSGFGVLNADTDPSLTDGIKDSMAQFLRPSGRILIGEYNRKLIAQMKSGDEIMKICEDEANSTANCLDHFVPIPNPNSTSRGTASSGPAASTEGVIPTAVSKSLTPLSGSAYIEKMTSPR